MSVRIWPLHSPISDRSINDLNQEVSVIAKSSQIKHSLLSFVLTVLVNQPDFGLCVFCLRRVANYTERERDSLDTLCC